jgi:hypothetical protein
MVNKLSSLAEFLNDDSLPFWLKREIQTNKDKIFTDLEKGQQVTLKGPSGEEVTIMLEPVPA